MQSPVRGVLTNHVSSEIQAIDMCPSAIEPHHTNTMPQEQHTVDSAPEREEWEELVGDR